MNSRKVLPGSMWCPPGLFDCTVTLNSINARTRTASQKPNWIIRLAGRFKFYESLLLYRFCLRPLASMSEQKSFFFFIFLSNHVFFDKCSLNTEVTTTQISLSGVLMIRFFITVRLPVLSIAVLPFLGKLLISFLATTLRSRRAFGIMKFYWFAYWVRLLQKRVF